MILPAKDSASDLTVLDSDKSNKVSVTITVHTGELKPVGLLFLVCFCVFFKTRSLCCWLVFRINIFARYGLFDSISAIDCLQILFYVTICYATLNSIAYL